MKNIPELNASFTTTLFLGFSTWEGGFIYADPEVSAGLEVSAVWTDWRIRATAYFKSSGFPSTPNLARIYFQQVFGPGGGDGKNIEDDQNQVAARQDISRLTVTIGKFSLNDFFDNNAYAHDARTQFINLGLVDNLALGLRRRYARLYLGIGRGTGSQRDWALRLCSAMVSTVANGPLYDANLGEARADNAEFEWRYNVDSRPVVCASWLTSHHENPHGQL